MLPIHTVHTPGLVMLNRHLADPTTPTAATFAAEQASNRRRFTDYDEGDILDELVGPAPGRGPSEPLRPPPHLIIAREGDADKEEVRNNENEEEDDDSASTCSSATAAADDRSTFSSNRGRSRISDTASVTSATSVSETSSVAPLANAAHLGSKSSRRRWRRKNRKSATASAVPETISETSSETAYETSSVADSVTPSMTKTKAGRNVRSGRSNSHGTNTSAAPNGSNLKAEAQGNKNKIRVKNNSDKTHDAAGNTPASRQERSKLSTRSLRETSRRDRSKRRPQLIIGLDLDAEIELKSRVQGDICLTLVMEEEAKMKPRTSPEVKMHRAKSRGRVVEVQEWDEEWEEEEMDKKGDMAGGGDAGDKGRDNAEDGTRGDSEAGGTAAGSRKGRREICHMRVAKFKLARRWWVDGYEMLARFPPPVVFAAMAVLPVAAFAAGWAASNNWSK